MFALDNYMVQLYLYYSEIKFECVCKEQRCVLLDTVGILYY